jgi:hypothetical protein
MKKALKLKSETIVAKLADKMTVRKQWLLDNGHVVANEITKKNGLLDNFTVEGNAHREFLKAVENTKAIFDFGFLLNVIEKAKPSGSADSDYIQAKTVEKVIKFVKAFGFKDFRMLDPHTRLIMFNAMYNNGVISSKGAFASLVKVEFDMMSEASGEVLKQRSSYSPGTGSAQMSSTKELFRILGLCDSVKGAKDAPIIFTDEAKHALIEHFDPIASAAKRFASDETEETEETEASE